MKGRIPVTEEEGQAINSTPVQDECENNSPQESEFIFTDSTHVSANLTKLNNGDSKTRPDTSVVTSHQNLSLKMTDIISTPATGRCVRSIYQGDFIHMQQETWKHRGRVRKYLVATDMSEEATHALEWTIGTVLRDGDTLLAIYCVDEEVGIVANDSSSDDKTHDHLSTIHYPQKRPASPTLGSSWPQNYFSGTRGRSTSNSDSSFLGRERSRTEQERFRAVHNITYKVIEFLRRTKLQVKVVIEVIHCKSPKHLINEVIDYISPTLVIIGSRRRSASKGVALGSFSTYIVSKSSVPVMVARKRLGKHSNFICPPILLANNIISPCENSSSEFMATSNVC